MQRDSIALSPTDAQTFQDLIWNYYRDHGRSFPWRHSDNPYHIVVSEIMLQQTQTDRVIEKYEHFLHCFPTVHALTTASLKDVLAAWQGLGYNRRGMYLYNAAKIIVELHQGLVPRDPVELQKLPGIGYATARSICAFAFNMPTVFIETNIRAVFIHTFFEHDIAIDDKLLVPLIGQMVNRENPREWYYALMDYGVMLKKKYPNPSRKSKHHTVQSKFEGSDRQIRGAIIRLLLERPYTRIELPLLYNADPERIGRIINKMISENIIHEKNSYLSIE
jgi:A/G-specific adenine glycosylase